MEGLIPFVYKAVKERRRRSYSRCSSAGSARGRFGAAAVDDDVVVAGQGGTARKADVGHGQSLRPAAGEREMTHRRHRSLEELAGEVGAAPDWREGGGMPRGRSVRIFSCIGGGGGT